MQNKKSQMEIMGLAIVVILLLVGLVFAIRFIVLKNPANFRKSFTSSEMASNMLNTFLKTHSEDCRKLKMSELMQDCAKGSTITCDDGKDSCSYAEDAAMSIFSNTFDKWDVNYHFTAFTEDGPRIIDIGDSCAGEKKSKTFFVPGTVTISVKLDIC